MKCMKRTLPFSMRLPEDLKAALQALADQDNRSLTNFIETELQKIVSERKRRDLSATLTQATDRRLS
jgi:predicted transcriptional regulator